MKHRRTRKQFRHAAPYGLNRLVVVAAGFLAAAATTGLLLDQAPHPVPASGSPAFSGVNMALADGSGGSASKAPAAPSPAPATPSSPPATAAPAKSAATTTPPAKPAAPPAPPSSKVLNFEYEAQINFYYCGPAATRIALTARGHSLSQDELASQLGTTTGGTNSAEDTTRVLNGVGGGDFYQTTSIPGPATPAQIDQLQADVVHAISNGYPLVANIVGSEVDVDGGSHPYDGGHYLTVVGYRDDGRTVQISDPAYVNGVSSYWMSTNNFANWMATRGYSA
jgi:hypothetical protein